MLMAMWAKFKFYLNIIFFSSQKSKISSFSIFVIALGLFIVCNNDLLF